MNQNMQTTQSASTNLRTPNGPDNPPAQAEPDSRYGSYGGTTVKQAGEGREVAAAGQPARTEAVTTLVPPVDIYEDETGLTLFADMPGVDKDQLGVRVTGDNLVIEGTASVPVMANMELLYGEVQTPPRSNAAASRWAGNSIRARSKRSSATACSRCAFPRPKKPSRAASASRWGKRQA
jgi:HSP20 family molecular chaperone IbpA